MSLALAVLAVAQPAPEARVPLTPTTPAAAVATFADVCMANFPDTRRFRHAIGRASAGFAVVEADRQWRSRDAVVSYVASGDEVAPQCSVDALLDQPASADKLIGTVQAHVRRHLGQAPTPMRAGDMVVWSWVEGERTQRLILDLGAGGATRQLALSLQQLR